MDWCVVDAYEKANHNPSAVLNGDRTKDVLTLPVKSGTEIMLSADGSNDPDRNAVQTTWWIYPEAGTIPGASLSVADGPMTTVKLPTVTKPGTLHVILQQISTIFTRLRFVWTIDQPCCRRTLRIPDQRPVVATNCLKRCRRRKSIEQRDIFPRCSTLAHS